MHGSVPDLSARVKKELRWLRRSTRDAGVALRCQMILHAAKGRRSRAIAEALGCHRSWVNRVLARWKTRGPLALLDGREDNGPCKLSEAYLSILDQVVRQTPADYGYPRPTWTCELLIAVMQRRTKVRVCVGTMSRALKLIGARRGRPRPSVHCPWSQGRKNKRLRALQRLAENPRAGDVVVYADEVDIHLNPKIGLDWMGLGQQKEVVTPGQNMKRYLAGALNAQTGRLTCVEGRRKNSDLFVALLAALVKEYPMARVIHVILDNFRIHHSRITQAALRVFGARIRLHFLPPYCPDANRIERIWLDLHAAVTRNHQQSTMDDLMKQVWQFLRGRNRRTTARRRHFAA
jgi:transposase